MKFVLGIDYGTDSVRSVLVNTTNGLETAHSVFYYPRWRKGLFCDASSNQFRQHPLDYIEGLEFTIQDILSTTSVKIRDQICGIAVDTTGSTPVAVDKNGMPLSLTEEFEENPNAMFVLWKDHTAIQEAEEINSLCKKWEVDYTRYSGGIYSSEWFWAKILHTIRVDPAIRESAYSWVEHCDWIPYLLTGGSDVDLMKRSRCAAGHKALWHPDFDGLPPNEFFNRLDPLLDGLRHNLYSETYTSDQKAGKLSPEWSDKLGLPKDVWVAVGAFDAHMGAVGGQIEPYHLSKVMGTSTCDMLVAPMEEVGNKLVSGICGQVDGSIIPGMMGLEAGQSAFGDVYAWFRDLLAWPFYQILAKNGGEEQLSNEYIEDLISQIIPRLSDEAAKILPEETGLVALDWLNGRRTPDANQSLKGAIIGLNLASNAPRIFRTLVESTCFGAKKIVDRFEEEGIPIKGIIGLGGVAKKSPFIMQTMADIIGQPIRIARSEQTCALGAAMFAAVAADIHPDISTAMNVMGAGFDSEYLPDPNRVEIYRGIFQNYVRLGEMVETEFQQIQG